jgi:hypothetical protein
MNIISSSQLSFKIKIYKIKPIILFTSAINIYMHFIVLTLEKHLS